MNVKVKTTITTKKEYSANGKSFWIQYTDEEKKPLKNVVGFALRDLKRGNSCPFTVDVSETGIRLNFNVDDKETQKSYSDILTKIIEDLK